MVARSGLVEIARSAWGEAERHDVAVVPAVRGVSRDDVDGLPHVSGVVGELEDVDAGARSIPRREQRARRPLLAHVESCEVQCLHFAFPPLKSGSDRPCGKATATHRHGCAGGCEGRGLQHPTAEAAAAQPPTVDGIREYRIVIEQLARANRLVLGGVST